MERGSLDFPLYFHVVNSTTASIRDFLRTLKVNPAQRLTYFEQLSSNPNLIPVISYNAEAPYVPNSYVSDENRLRQTFNRLAFRIFENPDFNTVLHDINLVIRPDDILLYDIGAAPHTQPFLQAKYNLLQQTKARKGCRTVIIRSAINPNIIFNRLIDGGVVLDADNSLLNAYSTYGFDAFGDFAGIRKDHSITDGGPEDPSPGFLFYCATNNYFIGYKGRTPDWNEFTNHIQPSVINSQTWRNHGPIHHQNCPGCQRISSNPGNSAGNWKRISIQHYLHTMEEVL
ncbi:hypothetical protein P4S96_17780 [Aneurinibacillus thermoaerophilus]|uniref:beta family protein n=1 Tax=Aneurinibacillus thermoaerophilus TaxID=143495 RepID=UPI002E221FA7|nr:hypothetical protein [Aneurinibacillus thermoaerophilus]